MKTFSTVEGLRREIVKRCNDALENEVKDIVVDELQKHIENDVYKAYKPKVYERRKENGGLSDPNNIVSSIQYDKMQDGVAKYTLSVYDVAPPDTPRYSTENIPQGKTALAKIIEQGAHNPWNNRKGKWTKPRPFVSNTQAYFNKHPNKILKAIEKQFKKH